MVAARAPNDYIANMRTQPVFPENEGKKQPAVQRVKRRPTTPQARVRVKFNNHVFVVIVEKDRNEAITRLNAYKKIASEAFLKKNASLLCAVVNAMMEYAHDLNKKESKAYWILITAYLEELRQISKKAA